MTKRFAITVTLTKTVHLDLPYDTADDVVENFNVDAIVYDMHRGDHDEDVECKLIDTNVKEVSDEELRIPTAEERAAFDKRYNL